MSRPILAWPDPRLRETARPVGAVTAEIRALAAEMLEAMYAAPGRGLAATQIGVPLRLFVMDAGWREGAPAPQVFVDPEIREASAARGRMTEGCLSLPGILAEVERPAEVTLAWTDLDGARQERRFTGFEAVCVQHETDHLDGRLCIDLLPEAAREALAPALARLEATA